MPRYLIDVPPERSEQLEPTLFLLGIRFDIFDNLTAVERDPEPDDVIFDGRDLEWLPGALNPCLEAMGEELRIREDPRSAGPGACQSLLYLARLHTDWGDKPRRREALEINRYAWERLAENHPALVHRVGEAPAPPAETESAAVTVTSENNLPPEMPRSVLTRTSRGWHLAADVGVPALLLRMALEVQGGLAQVPRAGIDEIRRAAPSAEELLRDEAERVGLPELVQDAVDAAADRLTERVLHVLIPKEEVSALTELLEERPE